MNQMPVILAAGVGWFFCFFRRKRYHITRFGMYFLLFIFTLTGALGSNMGSMISGGALAGRRLYGLMIADTVALVVGCRILKKDLGKIGDYISVPILSSCCGGKLNCLLDGCCYGFVMYMDTAGEAVRFPSQIFELVLWSLLSLWLIILEMKEHANNTLWALAMIWFGLSRYIVDFLRGSPSEKAIFVIGMPGGQFWSLVLFLMGLAYLLYSLKRIYGRVPTVPEFIAAMLGLQPNHKLTKMVQ